MRGGRRKTLWNASPIDERHVASLELSAKRSEVVVLEVVLDRERLESALVDLSIRLDLLEKRVKRCFKNGAQFVFPFVPHSKAGPRPDDYENAVRGLAIPHGHDRDAATANDLTLVSP